VIGFGAAVDYLSALDMNEVERHERILTGTAIERLSQIPELKILGPGVEEKGGVVAFYIKGIHAHDVAQILDSQGIAVRAGHHCAQPLHTKYNLPATSRASFYVYNTLEEIDSLAQGIQKAISVFA
jgi:cysteine desulfurase/selenocysteine lyase